MLSALYNKQSIIRFVSAVGLSALAGSMGGCASMSGIGDEGPGQGSRLPATINGQLGGISAGRSAECTVGFNAVVVGASVYDKNCGRDAAVERMIASGDKSMQAVGLRAAQENDPAVKAASKYVADYYQQNGKLPPYVEIRDFTFDAVQNGKGEYKLVRRVGVSPNLAR